MVEKLGISHGPWEYEKEDGLYGDHYFVTNHGKELGERTICKVQYSNADSRLIAAAPEMLLWVYGILKCADDNNMAKAAKLLGLGHELIKKATGKTWEEVKELINDQR